MCYGECPVAGERRKFDSDSQAIQTLAGEFRDSQPPDIRRNM